MQRGFSILECACTLAVLAIGGTTLVPAARRITERLGVLSAREEVVAILVRARGQALAHGGATVSIRQWPPTLQLLAGDDTIERVDLWERYHATLTLSGGRPLVELSFDELGVGSMASRSITLSRGSEVARVVISAYGRVRRE